MRTFLVKIVTLCFFILLLCFFCHLFLSTLQPHSRPFHVFANTLLPLQICVYVLPRKPAFSYQVALGIVFSIGMVVACAFKLYLGAPLYGVPNQDLALWLLDLVAVYPIAVSALFELLAWRDDNWRVNLAQDDDGDGKTSCKEHVKVRSIVPFQLYLFYLLPERL